MLIYILLIPIIVKSIIEEKLDLYTNRKDRIKGEERSVYHYKTKPKDNDSIKKLLDRIEDSTKVENRVVLWRRCIIISSLSIILIIFILHKRLPKAVEWVTGIVVVTLITYFAFNYYNYHLRRTCNNNVSQCIKLIKNKLYKKVCKKCKKISIKEEGKGGKEDTDEGNKEDTDD